MDDVDMDRVVGLDGEEAPPPPPPPAHGITSFTREQRAQALGLRQPVPGGRPSRPRSARRIRRARCCSAASSGMGGPPPWVLDVPGLRPPVPARLPPGSSLESLYREAVKQRLETQDAGGGPGGGQARAEGAAHGRQGRAFAAMYLREVGVAPEFRFSRREGAQGRAARRGGGGRPHRLGGSAHHRRAAGAASCPRTRRRRSSEARRRLAATQLFTVADGGGLQPGQQLGGGAGVERRRRWSWRSWPPASDREALGEGFRAFAALPEEARLRRLAYLAEAISNLEVLNRLPEGTEPTWLQGPEYRECDEREMSCVQALKARGHPGQGAGRWPRPSWACPRARCPRTATTTCSSTCAARCAARRSCWCSRRSGYGGASSGGWR